VRAALQDSGVRVRRSSRVALIPTGGTATSFAPKIAYLATIPRTRGVVLHGQDADARAKLFEGVRRACNELPNPEASSIFEAIRIGLAHERDALRCADPNACALWVHSDMLENVHPALTERIGRALQHSARGVVDSAVPRLDNSGVRVTICGYVPSANVGPRPDVDALLAIWRALFTHPDQVRAIPFCPGAAGDVRTATR
jgi:hypothetical protein